MPLGPLYITPHQALIAQGRVGYMNYTSPIISMYGHTFYKTLIINTIPKSFPPSFSWSGTIIYVKETSLTRSEKTI